MTGARFTLPTPARIVEIRQENYRTKTFIFDAEVTATPGQFVMIWLPRFDEKPFSLVDANPATLMITAVGPFSGLMHEKQVGERVWLRGPLGKGFCTSPQQRRVALVGGGYGVAPLHWLARTLAGKADAVTTIVGARSAADLLYVDRFRALESPDSITRYMTHCTTEDGSCGQVGRVSDALLPLLEAGQVDGIHACGPHGMLVALEALARRFALPCQLSWEAYMRCAIGVCGACEHAGKVLCLDGPVLNCEQP